jgi:3',5'-cyclic AMP phosphodiesterase CpdA
MDDFKPFLQIIHVSDLHVSDPKSMRSIAVRGWARHLRRLVPAAAAEYFEDGVAPHDNLAVGLFADFLKEITNDRDWLDCQHWLVDTGDLTSLGDSESLDLGQKYLNGWAKLCSELASIYGNHDAWPGTFPLVSKIRRVSKQKKLLGTRRFAIATPGLALQAPIPHGHGTVKLYFVDSIRYGRLVNSLALGRVPRTQLKALKALVDQSYDPDRHDFRILAVHHPVHYPPPRPNIQMSMTNDSIVGRELDVPSPGGAYPLAHLVLSGHTHFLYPEQGALPRQPSLCLHPELGNEQCQFVVGTLMQLDKYEKRLGWPHQCEVLRLYYSPSNRTVLLLERLLGARQAGENYRGTGIGPYKFVTLPGNGEETAEEISFNV